jgi:hypothetical protein
MKNYKKPETLKQKKVSSSKALFICDMFIYDKYRIFL